MQYVVLKCFICLVSYKLKIMEYLWKFLNRIAKNTKKITSKTNVPKCNYLNNVLDNFASQYSMQKRGWKTDFHQDRKKRFWGTYWQEKVEIFFLFMNNLMLLNLNRQSFGVIVTKSVQISIDVSLVHKL